MGTWADINTVKELANGIHALTLTLNALAFFQGRKTLQTEENSAWERKCCLSGGSWVLGSVLAAEMCPLDEPATTALSTFG